MCWTDSASGEVTPESPCVCVRSGSTYNGSGSWAPNEGGDVRGPPDGGLLNTLVVRDGTRDVAPRLFGPLTSGSLPRPSRYTERMGKTKLLRPLGDGCGEALSWKVEDVGERSAARPESRGDDIRGRGAPSVNCEFWDALSTSQNSTLLLWKSRGQYWGCPAVNTRPAK